MKSWKDFKKAVQELEFEEKIIGYASIALIISCFVPWFNGPDFTADGRYISFNGFQNDAFIIGFLIFSLGLINFGIILSRIFQKSLPRISMSYDMLMTYMGGEMLIFTIIGFFVYTKKSYSYAAASVRYGVYLTMFCALVITFFSWILAKRKKLAIEKKKEGKTFEQNYKDMMQPKMEMELDASIQSTVKEEIPQRPENAYQGNNSKKYNKYQQGRNIIDEALRQVDKNDLRNMYK